MQRTLPIEFDDEDALSAVAEICACLRDAEMLCYPQAGQGEGSTGKPGSRPPKGNPEGLELLEDIVTTLKETVDGRRDKNGRLTFTGIRKRIDRHVARETRRRASATCLEVQACVEGEAPPCGKPKKCHLALESAIAQAMPKDAVAKMREQTPEERSEAARRAADARWSKYATEHRN
jgi:hypothetical protein